MAELHQVGLSSSVMGSIRRSYITILSSVLVLSSIAIVLAIVLAPYQFSLEAFLAKGGKRMNLVFPGIGESGISDGILNMLLFFPIGFFFTLLGISLRWSFWSTAACIGVTSLVLSYWVEFMQLFLPGRFPALFDVFSNTFGGYLGFFAFYLIHQEHKRR